MVAPVPSGELAEAPSADPVGGFLRAQVGKPLLREAHPPSEVTQDVGGITTPSSSKRVELAGMLPGVGPPTSAWCALQAAKPIGSSSTKTGEIRVMSGRWVPPR
jgi:hypothetical protein